MVSEREWVLLDNKDVLSGQTLNGTVSGVATLETCLRHVVTGILLSYYLLPRTPWSSLFPLGRLLPRAQAHDCLLYHVLGSVLAALSVCIYFWRSCRSIPRLCVWLSMAFYLACLSIISLGMREKTVGGADQAMHAALVATPFAIGLICTQIAGTTHRMLRIISILSAVQALYALYGLVSADNVMYSGTVMRLGGTFNHPFGVYTVTMVGLPCAFVCAKLARTRNERRLLWASFVVMLLALLFTWERGGILGGAVSLYWLGRALLAPSASRRIGLAVGLILALSLAVRTAGPVNSASSRRSLDGRYFLWKQSIRVWRQQWLCGAGLGQLKFRTRLYEAGAWHPYTIEEPKSLPLFVLAESGTLGIACLIVFAVSAVTIIKQASCRGGRSVAAACIGAVLLAFLVAGLTDTPLLYYKRPYGNALLGAIVGALLILPKERDGDLPTVSGACGCAAGLGGNS